MKTIQFQEIIECSSQQSLLTGQAGFGIRTLTEGMNYELARSICEQENFAYEVGVASQLTLEAITQDASITRQYPRTLKYLVYPTDNGETKYIVACTTYIGIDYGYFCQHNSAQRAGTNYIADILVFNEEPDMQLISQLLEQEKFLPVDNTCTPDNPELQALLTGEPAYLKPREITVEEKQHGDEEGFHARENIHINKQTALVAIALLQAKLNERTLHDASLQKIVFQAREAKIPSILRDFSILPDELTHGKYFQTNYLQGYGMPHGYQMIFLNEHNQEEVYIDNYVYANLDDESFRNVDTENKCFLQIRKAAENDDYQQFQKHLEIICSLIANPQNFEDKDWELTIDPETGLPVIIDIRDEEDENEESENKESENENSENKKDLRKHGSFWKTLKKKLFKQ